MTCREKLAIEYPYAISEEHYGGCFGCPHMYGYLPRPEYCSGTVWLPFKCDRCWSRTVSEEPSKDILFPFVTIEEMLNDL